MYSSVLRKLFLISIIEKFKIGPYRINKKIYIICVYGIPINYF